MEALSTKIERLDARVEALEAQLKLRPEGGEGKAETVIDVDKFHEPDPAMDDDLNLVVQPDTDLEGEFRLQTSIWDASLFIGHSHVGIAGSLALALLLVANVVIQGTFCWIAMEHFTKSRYGDAATEALKWWRTDAHSLKWSQEGMSLVERVCGGDPTLMIGTDVKARIKMIKEYLPEFAEYSVASGPALSLLALFLWYGMVSKEINGIINFSMSMICLKKGSTTRLERLPNKSIELTVLSRGRSIIAAFVATLRFATAWVLIYVGTLRTVYTTNWGGILLNAVKLGLILNVDDLLFDVVAPKNVKGLFQKLKPLRKPPVRTFRGWDLPSCVTLVLISAGLVIAYSLVIVPELEHQLDAYNAVCAGDRTFLQKDQFGLIVWTSGEAYEARDPDESVPYVASMEVVELNGGEPDDPLVGLRVPNVAYMEAFTQFGANEISSIANPMCTDLLGGAVDQFTAAGDSIDHAEYLRTSTGNRSISSCRDVAQYCGGSGRRGEQEPPTVHARRFCAHTCMCNHPGALFDRDYCSTNCAYHEPYAGLSRDRQCVDTGAAELQGSAAWQSLARDNAATLGALDNAMARSMVEPGSMLSSTPPSFAEAVLAVQNLSVAEAHESLFVQLGCAYNGLTTGLFSMLGGLVSTMNIHPSFCHHCPEECNCHVCSGIPGGCANCPPQCA